MDEFEDYDLLEFDETDNQKDLKAKIDELYADYQAKKKQAVCPMAPMMARKKKKYPIPAPEAGYPFPKKMEEFLADPRKFEEFENKAAEDEQKVKDYEIKISELNKRIADFEAVEKNEKVSELLNLQEKKGLIAQEMKDSLAKDYSTKFSIEQLDSMLKNFSAMNFSRITEKSEESSEAKPRDFESKKKELEERIHGLEEVNVKGPYYDELVAELKTLG